MIRLLRDLGSLSAGAVTDQFDAASEAAFLLDGTAGPVDAPAAQTEPDAAREPAAVFVQVDGGGVAPDYSRMKKDDLLRLAISRGLAVSPRAKVAEIVEALELSDDPASWELDCGDMDAG